MEDLINAMTKVRDKVGVHRACMYAMTLPPPEKQLIRAAQTNSEVAKSFSSAVPVAETRLRRREKKYKQSDDITLARAVHAINLYNETKKNPYPDTDLMDYLRDQETQIKAAHRQATRLFGRLVDYNNRWVFLILRLNSAAEAYHQRDACRNIVRLMAINAIDDRAAYYFAGQLLGGNVSQSDRFFHVSVGHVSKAHSTVLASRLAYNDYQEAFEVFRFARPIYQNNPQALKILCDYLDEVYKWLSEGLIEFRALCVHPPGLGELVKRHFPVIESSSTAASRAEIPKIGGRTGSPIR